LKIYGLKFGSFDCKSGSTSVAVMPLAFFGHVMLFYSLKPMKVLNRTSPWNIIRNWRLVMISIPQVFGFVADVRKSFIWLCFTGKLVATVSGGAK
jgi:hypothetical protein